MKRLLACLLMAAVIILPCSALALNITVTGVGAGKTVDILYTPPTPDKTSSWAGKIFVNIQDLNDPGWAFCVDLDRTIGISSYTYTPVQPPDPKQYRQAAWLIEQYYSDSLTNAQAAALQGAIWEVVYRDAFALTGPADVMTAYAALTLPDVNFDWAASNYVMLKVFSGTTEVQTLITRVPEPMTMILFGLGLLGLAGMRRKE